MDIAACLKEWNADAEGEYIEQHVLIAILRSLNRMRNGGIVPDHNKAKNVLGHRFLKYRIAFKIPQSFYLQFHKTYKHVEQIVICT